MGELGNEARPEQGMMRTPRYAAMPTRDPIQESWFSSLPDSLQRAILATNALTNRDIPVYFRSYHGAHRLAFDVVPEELRTRVAVTSTFSVALNCYLDYWADTAGRSDIVDEAARCIFEREPPKAEELSDLPRIWSGYIQSLEIAPRIDATMDLIMQEWSRFFRSLYYSIEINQDIDALDEPFTYRSALANLSGNMLGTHKHVVDMSFSPGWEPAWTDPAIALGREMDKVVRIGNCLKSWRQEISMHADFSNMICAVAIEHGVVDTKALKTEDSSILIARLESTEVESLGGRTIEVFLADRVAALLSSIEVAFGLLHFVDVRRYVDALRQTVADQHQGSVESR